jgi:hypothetical protein
MFAFQNLSNFESAAHTVQTSRQQLGKRLKVAAVFAVAKLFCQAPLAVDVAHMISDLLDAGDLN